MAAEFPSNLRQLELRYSPTPLRLREALEACSSSIDSGYIVQSDAAVAPVTTLLQTLVELPPFDLEAALDEIHRFVSSPDSNQMVVEALSFELPKLVIKFASLSDKCRDIAGRIIEHFASVCSPREMLSVLCEALSSRTDTSEVQGCYSHILIGLSKVLLRIQRRHIEQVKVVLPIILGVLNVASETAEEDDDFLKDLFSAAISIGSSIQEICQKKHKEKKICLLYLAFMSCKTLPSYQELDNRILLQVPRCS